ncbi:MAG: hypothetical protein IT576_14690, partial [Verrucomicrobiales bacterium]|nr:hypothetical protein [Verrucomicrobiales bacterium]
LSYRGSPDDGFIGRSDWAEVRILSPGSGKMPEAGVRFFFILRELDALGLDEIIAEPVPERAMGRAIMDRLRRASVRYRNPNGVDWVVFGCPGLPKQEFYVIVTKIAVIHRRLPNPAPLLFFALPPCAF